MFLWNFITRSEPPPPPPPPNKRSSIISSRSLVCSEMSMAQMKIALKFDILKLPMFGATMQLLQFLFVKVSLSLSFNV
jgi:hypothetical protein